MAAQTSIVDLGALHGADGATTVSTPNASIVDLGALQRPPGGVIFPTVLINYQSAKSGDGMSTSSGIR